MCPKHGNFDIEIIQVFVICFISSSNRVGHGNAWHGNGVPENVLFSEVK